MEETNIPQENSKLEIFTEEANQKAKKLSEKHKTDVDAYVFVGRDKSGEETGDLFVAFVKEPDTFQMVKAFDDIMAGRISQAGYTLMQTCFLKEDSTSDIEQQKPIMLGLSLAVGDKVKLLAPEAKKK